MHRTIWPWTIRRSADTFYQEKLNETPAEYGPGPFRISPDQTTVTFVVYIQGERYRYVLRAVSSPDETGGEDDDTIFIDGSTLIFEGVTYHKKS